MLTPTELAQLRLDVLDLIADRAADILGVPRGWLGVLPDHVVLPAMLEVLFGLREVVAGVARELDRRALDAGLTRAGIARAQGTTRQAASQRVKGASR